MIDLYTSVAIYVPELLYFEGSPLSVTITNAQNNNVIIYNT